MAVNGYMRDKALDKIKETIYIVKFDDIKILIDKDDIDTNYQITLI